MAHRKQGIGQQPPVTLPTQAIKKCKSKANAMQHLYPASPISFSPLILGKNKKNKEDSVEYFPSLSIAHSPSYMSLFSLQ